MLALIITVYLAINTPITISDGRDTSDVARQASEHIPTKTEQGVLAPGIDAQAHAIRALKKLLRSK